MDTLLPRDHFLNKTWIRILVYGITYPLLCTLSIPTINIVTREDTSAVKLELFERYHVVYPDIFSTEVVCGHLGSQNPTSYVAVGIILVALSYVCFLSFYSWLTIHKILQQNLSQMSRDTKKQHLEVMPSLGSMVVAGGSLIVLTVFPIILLAATESWRADLYVYAIFYVGIGVPFALITFIVTYRPYRRIQTTEPANFYVITTIEKAVIRSLFFHYLPLHNVQLLMILGLTYEHPFDLYKYTPPTLLSKISIFCGLLGMLTALLAIFCLLMFSRKEYRAYKWYLIVQMINTFLFDLLVTVGLGPVLILPLPCAYATGFIGYSWKINTDYMLGIVYALLIAESVCYLNLVLHRHQTLLPDEHKLKIQKKTFTSLSLLWYFIAIVPIIVFTCLPHFSKKKSFTFYAEFYKIPEIVLTIPNLHCFDIRDPIAMGAMGWSCFMVSVIYGIVFFAMLHMRQLIHSQQHLAAISPATKDMHRTLFISLFFQLVLPLVFIAIPGFAMLVVPLLRIYIVREMSDLVLLLWGLHGFVCALTLIVVNKRFRNGLVNIVRKIAEWSNEE